MAVANALLAHAWGEGESVTPMKLQKLLYFAHGWYLGLYGKPLVNEEPQAWQYGPVFESAYQEFKHYQAGPITKLATSLNEQLDFEPILLSHEEADQIRPIVERIWDVYGAFTGPQLSAMTHRPGTPWDLAIRKDPARPGARIGDDLSKAFFAELIANR
ncbi:MAG: DUF4065 domain-containing protein [Fimbriimonadaceae bacterium]|nr:DUF4065 domain-containing protein [Fimbriimonadaceae bacterium]